MEEEPEKHPQALDYRDPREDYDRSRILAAVFGTAIVTTLGLLMMVFVLAYVAFAMDYRGFDKPSGIAGQIIAITLGAIVVAGLIVLAIRSGRDPDRRGMMIGIWVGLGLAALIEGLCWVNAH